MSINGLNSALAGLRTAQAQLEMISSNISNVGTEGYTRKTIAQETIAINGKNVGINVSPALRNVNLNLARDFWTQVSSVSFYEVQAGYLNKIQTFHGEQDQGISIAAKIAELKNKFAALAETPEDPFQQKAVVNQAVDVASRINSFANLLTEMRNDAQGEIEISINKINDKLQNIAALNQQIKIAKNTAMGTANLEDQRDQAVRALAEEIGIKFYVRADGVMNVQTQEGMELVADLPQTLYFNRTQLDHTSYYPASASGIYIGGNPATNPNSFDATELDLGGRLGALVETRDDVLPRQQAMLDELAHKLAMRMDMQGLLLFTDAAGNVSADTAPDPNTGTPVGYVGFSSTIRVNANILRDNSLVQTGTAPTDNVIQSGSNEVVRRIVNFAFGDVAYQEISGTRDLRASGDPTTLQEWLGVYSQNQVKSTSNLSGYADIAALQAAANGDLTGADQFTITFEESRTTPALGPTTITIDLSDAATNFPIDGVGVNDALDQIISEINAQITAATVDPALAAVATRNSYGQLVLQSRGNITLDATFVGGMGEDGMEYLGLAEGEFETTDPYIDIQIGADPAVRVTIEPGEDETDLIAKLEKTGLADDGVPGLAVSLDAATGFLSLRPGDVFAQPNFGGELKISGGTFTADGTGTVAGGVTAGTSLVAALFGANAPVTDVKYLSATGQPGVTTPFRSQYLGPRANLDTGTSGNNLIDFAQKIINSQSEEVNRVETLQESETSFRNLLQNQLLDQSAVNIDEELSHMIVVQTAFSAAARVISSIDEQFRELLQTF